MSANPTKPKNTSAYMAQAAIAFAVSLFGTGAGIAYLPLDGWQRAFLAMSGLFLVTSCFTLAKVVRDQQETQSVMSRLDEARIEQLIAEHNPFKSVS